MALLPLFLLAAASANAQAFRSQFAQIRATVPVGSTNTSVLGVNPANNNVVLVNGATNANFDISGLPAGAAAVLTDTNGNALTSTTQSTNLWITLLTTNIPEGVYNFTLNIGGLDTNGLPVTNSFPFVLQSAYIWNGSGLGVFGLSNNWATATNWLGGAPGAADDVVIANAGAQTNAPYAAGISNNIGIDTSVTVASIRFAQTVYTNATTTNSLFHSIRIGPGATLSVTGTNGFNLLRDYIGEFGYSPDPTMGINFSGSNGIGGTLMVSNAAANFGILVGNGLTPSLSLSNLSTFVTYVSRFGVSDYQLYPNYRALNNGFNAGRDLTSYSGRPRQFLANFYMARTNYITATYVDPNNYTNESTRSYAVSLNNNEQSGNNTASFFYLGLTNVFRADSVCFVGANSQSVNPGVRFGFGRFSSAIFRGTNGGRMSVFTISDGGGTNQANSNMKATIDFSGATNYVDILADRLYIARDRVMIASNQTPNVQGDLTIGYGNVDVNTAVLGYQEHSNKVDWTSLYGAPPYLNYCEGRLVLTNGGGPGTLPCTFKVNGNLTLGYTADMNPVGSAQQYNTYGQITILSNATLIASNIICDGGLNYFDNQGRRNTITINQGGNVIVTNQIGYNSSGANNFSAASPNGMRLDTLTMTASTLTLFVNPSKTNVFVRTLTTLGTIPSVIKVAALTGVSSYPAQIPVISYLGSASPFLTADVSSLGAGYFGFILNNLPNHSIDIYITTNAPNSLVWTGNANNNWDTTTLNWVTTNGVQTNFNLGDLVKFNDSSTVTNVNIVGSVIPGQTGVGVTISNSASQYTFSGGTVAGTALVVKQGTNFMIFNSSEQGPIQILAGSVFGNGNLGSVIVASNVVLSFAGNINGGLVSTGNVFFAGGTLNGPISLQGGTFFNLGTVYTGPGGLVTMAPGTTLTNTIFGTMNIGIVNGGTGVGTSGSTWDVPFGCTLANFGTINLYQPRIQVEGLLYGGGTINDPNGGGFESIANGNAPRVLIQQTGILSPGPTPEGTISNMTLFCRLDFNNDPTSSTTPGIGTIRIEVDFSNPQINDILYVDRWNNDTGLILMTNINPGAGSFSGHAGQVFTVFNNNGSDIYNEIDTLGFCPTISPYTPGAGLVWGVTNFNRYGTISVTNSPMVWDGVSSANWNTNASDLSWKTGKAFSDNLGAVFDDSANGSTTVNLTGWVAPESYQLVIITNIVGVSTNFVFVTNQPAFYPGIIVSNATKNYVFVGGAGGKISGSTGLYKTGPGTLTLMTSNCDFSGNVIVDNGTLAVTNFGGVNTIVSLGSVTFGQMKNEIILDGGTLSYVGTTNVQLGHHIVLNPNGGTINVASSTNVFTVNNNIVIPGAIGGGALIKTGPGTLQLVSTVNNYPGGTTVNAGTLRLITTAAGSGGVTLANNSALELTNGVGGAALGMTLTNAINITGAGTAINILGISTNISGAPWSGGGTVTITTTNAADLFVFNGDMSGFSGTVSFGTSSNQFRFNNRTNDNPCTGSASATFNLGTGSASLYNYNGSNLVYNLGALAGGANTILSGRFTNSAEPAGTIYSIGANGSSTTFSGKITNGLDTVSIVKVGSGTLLLNGVSTYTGPTTVSNGVLGGTGSIASPLTVTAGGTLSPGASVGTFTVSNNATLGGTVLMELNEASASFNDMLAVSGTIAATGALVVTNVGPDLYNHTTFKLFSQAVTGFSSVTLPAKDPSNMKTYTWNNNLSVDGTIQLVSGGTVNPNPTNISFSVSGGILTLSWPADRTGWRLQVQTNSLSVGLGTNWVTVPGSTNVNSVLIPIDANNGSVFYRLTYP